MSELTEYFRRHLTLVLDNDQISHEEVNRIARDYIVNEEITMEEYRGMTTRTRADQFAAGIGEQILEYVNERVEEVIGGDRSLGALLIGEIMLGSDTELEWALGDHYMPEDSDMEGLLDEDEDDEQD
jgi:hypothetical protein